MKTILYKPIGDHVVPAPATAFAAGWDLTASEEVWLWAMQPILVPTNLEVAIPEGHMLLVLPRSGNSLKKSLIVPNSPGLIDSDYRGHLQVILTWLHSPSDREQPYIKISKGDRIAQAVLVPYVVQSWVRVDELPKTDRGSGGFGSTGV